MSKLVQTRFIDPKNKYQNKKYRDKNLRPSNDENQHECQQTKLQPVSELAIVADSVRSEASPSLL